MSSSKQRMMQRLLLFTLEFVNGAVESTYKVRRVRTHYAAPVRKIHIFFVFDFIPTAMAALEIGSLNQKGRPYAPPVANSCLRHCNSVQRSSAF